MGDEWGKEGMNVWGGLMVGGGGGGGEDGGDGFRDFRWG